MRALKNWRIVLLLIFLVLALIEIRPAPWHTGVAIRSTTFNSSAAEAGIQNPKTSASPLDYERIISINGMGIASIEDYKLATKNLKPNQTLPITTNIASYVLTVRPLFKELMLNKTEPKITEVFDNKTNRTTSKTIFVPKVDYELIGVEEIGLKVVPAATSNIRKGLDLAGGSRVLLKPDEDVSREDIQTIVQSLTERLNVYGLNDVVVRDARDLGGDTFISVEIAGATEDEMRNLVGRQGKFEAKIANTTVFIGGKRDVTYVCRTAECSGLDPQQPCGRTEAGYGCSFFFSIALSSDAAQRQADATSTLSVGSDRYLSHPLELYLDDKLVDTLQIAADLKGRAATQIAISGSGQGSDRQLAQQNALESMRRLQAVMTTGSLPVKLSIVKIDTISPVLGDKFMKNVLLMAVTALFAVSLVVTLRYRNIRVSLPMVLIIISEMILILGFAAFAGWNLDLAAMAGIIISIGTGVDHLIVIADETRGGQTALDWKKRLKNALFIIMGAYFTVVAGMIPLWFAGAGILKGFAFTTIVGISFGVLIARPAYAAILKVLLNE